MIWSLDLDDFNGSFCKQGKYPLLTTVKKTLKKAIELPKSLTNRGIDRSFYCFNSFVYIISLFL
jgi:hypothetical protein